MTRSAYLVALGAVLATLVVGLLARDASLLPGLLFWGAVLQGAIALCAASDIAQARWHRPFRAVILALHPLLLAFPLAFLVFMVPLPAIVMNAVAFPLQLFAAQSATFCMQVGGIPVLREGNTIVLSNTTLEVVEACSGIRSLQALLALGAIYGYFSQKAVWKRWALLVLAIPIAIAANAFRVAGTGFLAHFIGPEAAHGFYHSFAGWIVFAVAFVLMLGAGTLLGKLPDGFRKPAEGQP